MIDSDGTEASSDDENNRFCGIESAELQAFPCIAGQQFLADWRSGQNGFVFRETFNGFREITADLCSRTEYTVYLPGQASYPIHG